MGSRPLLSLLASLLLLSLFSGALAKDVRYDRFDKQKDPDRIWVLDCSAIHNVGNLHMNVTNWGCFGSYPGSTQPTAECPSAQWPANSGVEHLFIASTHDYVLFFTDNGQIYWLKVYAVPSLGRTAQGRHIVNLLGIPNEESITSMIPVRDFEHGFLLMATEQGVVKKTRKKSYGRPRSAGLIAIKIDELAQEIRSLRAELTDRR